MFKTQCGSAIDGYKGAVAVRRICNSPASPHLHHLVEEEDCRRCTRNEPPKTPPLAARIVSYADAVTNWIAAGRPVRSGEEVRAIYKTHCQPCAVARIGNGRVSRLRVPHSRSWSGRPEQDQDGDRALPSSDLVRKCPAIASQLRRTRRSLPAQAHAARNGSTR